jgi:hypothetical protein
MTQCSVTFRDMIFTGAGGLNGEETTQSYRIYMRKSLKKRTLDRQRKRWGDN